MGSGCGKCCGKVQDWCRDSCGCCPCKCCKTAKVEVKAQQTVEHKIEKKEIPFGYGVLHAGIRTTDGTYTSPVLEIHTWRQSRIQTTTDIATGSQRIALGGIQTERDNADHHLGPARGAERRRMEIDEEINVIPIESIISSKYSSEIKKGLTEFRHILLQKRRIVKLSCCEKMNQWCNKTFCCCCNNSKRQIHNEPEQIITTISNEEAERKILITIEYIRYSNIHTPSHIRVLSEPDQQGYYNERFHTDTLEFYLVDNCDFDQADFDLKQFQASTICRLVTQLKTMVGYYPDESTLEQIIGKQGLLVIGDAPQESIERLVGPGRTNNSLEVTVPYPAIKHRP